MYMYTHALPLKFIWQLQSLKVTPLWKSRLRTCIPDAYSVNHDLGVSVDYDANIEEGVEIPSAEIEISQEQVSKLESRVNHLDETDDFGVDLFIQTLHFIQSLTPIWLGPV